MSNRSREDEGREAELPPCVLKKRVLGLNLGDADFNNVFDDSPEIFVLHWG